jgi:hypothetical protein
MLMMNLIRARETRFDRKKFIARLRKTRLLAAAETSSSAASIKRK